MKVKAKANPFQPEYDEYLCNRTKWRAKLAKESKQITTFMSDKTDNIFLIITVSDHITQLLY
jgi:hypothetical protein